jgi:hypothetical protein
MGRVYESLGDFKQAREPVRALLHEGNGFLAVELEPCFRPRANSVSPSGRERPRAVGV